MTGKKVAKAKKKPKLVTPSHGRGKIYEGGVPGNKGGTGRPPSELRDAMREILDGNLEKLEQLINDPDVRPGDKIRAFEVLARFSIGTSDEVAVAADVVNRVDIENAAGKFRERIELLRQRGAWAEPVEILPKLPTDAVPALPPPKKAAPKQIPKVVVVVEDEDAEPAPFHFPPGRGMVPPDSLRVDNGASHPGGLEPFNEGLQLWPYASQAQSSIFHRPLPSNNRLAEWLPTPRSSPHRPWTSPSERRPSSPIASLLSFLQPGHRRVRRALGLSASLS